MRSNLFVALFLGIMGCGAPSVDFGRSPHDVERLLQGYYSTKYGTFRELVALSSVGDNQGVPERVAKLYEVCPVREIVNSFPNGPLYTFLEITDVSDRTICVTSIDLYRRDNNVCRVVVSTRNGEKVHGVAYSSLKPLTIVELRKLAAE